MCIYRLSHAGSRIRRVTILALVSRATPTAAGRPSSLRMATTFYPFSQFVFLDE